MKPTRYTLLESLADTGVIPDLESESAFLALYSEVKATRKKMAILPTVRESEALPELQLLARVAQVLARQALPAFHAALDTNPKLARLFYEDYLEGVAGDVIRARVYCNKEIVRVADEAFIALVAYCAQRLPHETPALFALLNTIIDKNADYYKSNGKEGNYLEWPFGEQLRPSESSVAWVAGLKRGDAIDCMKSYGNRKCWSRAVYDGPDGTLTRVRFLNESNFSYISNPEYEIAPVGSKSVDYEWREGLREGDQVDYFHYKSEWLLARVDSVAVETNMYGDVIKTAVIRWGNDAPKKDEADPAKDSAHLAYRDDIPGFLKPIDQTFSVKVHSPSLAPPGSRSGKPLLAINDSEDAALMARVKEPKWAILRSEGSAKNSSIYFVKYLNAFGAKGGFDFLADVAAGKRKVAPETVAALTQILQNVAEFLVAPFVQAHGQSLLNWLTENIGQNVERNIRTLTQQNLANYMEAVVVLTKRVYPEPDATRFAHEAVVRTAVACLRSEILEKQFFGAKKLIEVEDKIRGEDPHGLRPKLAQLLVDEGIFEKILKGHPNLIEKGSATLKVLFTENRVTEAQVTAFWEQVRKADSESKSALLGMARDISWEMSPAHVRFLLAKIMENPEEPGTEFLEVISALRKVAQMRHKDTELVNLLNGLVWKLVQEDGGEKPALSKELVSLLVRNIPPESRTAYFSKAIDGLLAGQSKERQLKIMLKIIKAAVVASDEMCQKLREKNVIGFCIQEIRQNFALCDHLESTESELSVKSAGRTVQPVPARKVLKFLTGLLSNAPPSAKDLFGFGQFEQIWDAVFDAGVQEKQIQTWLYDYLKTHKNVEDIPLYRKFFETRLPRLTRPGGEEFFHFFMLLFLVVNELEGSLVSQKVQLENCICTYKTSTKTVFVPQKPFGEMFGGELLWQTLLDATSPRLFTQLAGFISNFNLPSEFAERIQTELYANQRKTLFDRSYKLFMEGKPLGGQKAAVLLTKMIRNEEVRRGFGLVSFAQLKEGERIRVHLEKEQSYLKQRTSLDAFENQTLYQLREAVAAEAKVPFEVIGLARESGAELNTTDNLMTLEAVGVTNQIILIVKERETEPVEFQFMNELRNDFSPSTRRAFREVFQDFSSDGRMSREQFRRLRDAMGANIYYDPKEETEAVLFDRPEAQDAAHPGTIDFERFLDAFRRVAVVGGERGVVQLRQNLYALGFNKSLRSRKFPIETDPAEVQKSIRLRLANDSAFFAQLLKYIAPFFEPDPVDPERSGQSVDAQDQQDATEILVWLLEMLPPSFDDVRRAWADPAAFLAGPANPFLNYYRTVIFNALLFRTDFKDALKRFHPETFGSGYAGFLARAMTPACMAQLNQAITAASNSQDFPGWPVKLHSSAKLLERLLKVAIMADEPEFVDTLRTLTSYIVRRRQKQAESQAQPAIEAAETDAKGASSSKDGRTKDKKDGRSGKEEKELEESRLAALLRALTESELLGSLNSSFNLPEINTTILKSMGQVIPVVSDAEPAHPRLVRALATALICSLKLKEAELRGLLSDELFTRTMLNGMTSPSSISRVFFKNAYSIIASEAHSVEFKTGMLKVLISALGAKEKEELHGLVELSCSILGEIGELKARHPAAAEYLHSALNFGDLFRDFNRLLIAHESAERQLDDESDGLLVSYLAFLEKILKADERVLTEMGREEKQELVLFLFRKCLFEVGPDGISLASVKCKSRRSRALALDLLKLLLRGDHRLNVLFLAGCLNPLGRAIPSFQVQTQTTANPERRAKGGFVGIRNPGCVCYMIATLQQFYCTPVFRYGMLMADDGADPKPTPFKGRQVDDSVFHQFQKMLAYLDRSERRDFDPHDFCFSYKDYSGEPTNVSVQQDADEFLKVLLERLETSLKGSPLLGVLNSAFLGKVCNVLTCKGCGHEKTNEENFFNISLEVKKMRGLAESLDKLVQEEIVSDYLCESCKKKCDISKRALLQRLPNVLIFSLKKMCFDLELLMNVKIHSRYEFPMNVNLRPYMYGGQADKGLDPDQREVKDEDCEYRLVGVVVHKGNAEFGHYTSLVNADRGDPSRPGQSPDLWFEFDDSRVAPFDMAKFEEECFGNADDKDAAANDLIMENYVSKSAYLLFYEKVKKDPLVLPFTAQTDHLRPFVLSQLIDPADARQEPDSITTGFFNLKPFCPPGHLAEITADNRLLGLEQNLLSKSFTNTLAEIVQAMDLSYEHLAVNEDPSETTVLKHTLADAILVSLPPILKRVYHVAYENFKVKLIVGGIVRALNFLSYARRFKPAWEESANKRIAAFFKEQVVDRLPDLMGIIVTTNDAPLRNGLIEFVVQVFSTTIENFDIEHFHALEHPPADPPAHAPTPAEELRTEVTRQVYDAVKLIKDTLDRIDSWSAQNKRIGVLFGVLRQLAEDNACVTRLLADHNFLQSMYELYLSTDGEKLLNMEPILEQMLGLVRVLYEFQEKHAEENEGYEYSLHEVPKTAIIQKAVSESLKEDNFSEVNALVRLFCTDDRVSSEIVAFHCLKSFGSKTESKIFGQLEGLRALLSIHDSLDGYRLRLVLGVPRLVQHERQSSEHGLVPVYGLAGDQSLKATVVNYLSPCAQKKGLLDWAWSCKDSLTNVTMMILSYLLDFANDYDDVLDYLIGLDPPNYLSATVFDWWRPYLAAHSSTAESAYAALKTEFEVLHLNQIPAKLDAFRDRVKERIAARAAGATGKVFASGETPYGDVFRSSQWQVQPDTLEPLLAAKDLFIIWDTHGKRTLGKKILAEAGNQRLIVKVGVVNVSVTPSLPRGLANLAIPPGRLSSAFHVTHNGLHPAKAEEKRGGFGIKKKALQLQDHNSDSSLEVNMGSDSSDNELDIKDSFGSKFKKTGDDLSDFNQPVPHPMAADEPPRPVAASEPVPHALEPKKVDFVVRITSSSTFAELHMARIKVAWPEVLGAHVEFISLPLKPNTQNQLVYTLTLPRLDLGLEGLKVLVSHKRVNNEIQSDLNDAGYSEWEAAFDGGAAN
jgi:ubiquitin C-terminal hydrolase